MNRRQALVAGLAVALATSLPGCTMTCEDGVCVVTGWVATAREDETIRGLFERTRGHVQPGTYAWTKQGRITVGDIAPEDVVLSEGEEIEFVPLAIIGEATSSGVETWADLFWEALDDNNLGHYLGTIVDPFGTVHSTRDLNWNEPSQADWKVVVYDPDAGLPNTA